MIISTEMARNREPVKPVESQSESGEEEDDEGSSEEVDSQESDSEPEQTQTATPKKSQPQLPVKSQQPPPPPPQSQPPSSSEEEESGSETESDSDGPDSNVRPLASKPMEEAQKTINGARKPRSKPNAPEPVTPTKPSAAKRPSEDTASKDAKKSKKTADPEASEKKPNLFQRLWSEEDEILILKGMIEYSSKNKSDPISDMNAFYDFIKKSLHIDFSRTQLQDKIRRLKKKYENNKSKEKEGKERTFAKLHEQSAYDLSKEIWGNDTGKENGGEKVVGSPKANGSVGRKTPNKKANAVESGEVKDAKKAVVASGEGDGPLPTRRLNLNPSGANMEERMLTNGREIYEVEQGLEGEKEWKKLRVEELELYLKQLEVRIAQTKLVLNVMKDGDH